VTQPAGLLSLSLQPGQPDFIDLPWQLPLASWRGATQRLVEMQRGISRHEVVFVEYGSAVFALKELPPGRAEREYGLLRGMEERRLPSVVAAGHARALVESEGEQVENSVLLTRYLDGSLPYRTLFMNQGLERYRERLLDAMAGLLVRLHLGGCYWGDCSLSNTLFRRDAGELQAYAVDAETSELHEKLSDGQRALDLQILEENLQGDLSDLELVAKLPPALSIAHTGESIRRRYQRLWSEISRVVVLSPHETYLIQDRIRALNELGFSVGELELLKTGEGDRLKLRTIVVDRDYHRRLLHGLTGLVAGDRQAALLVGEIKELQAQLAQEQNRSVSQSMAAYRWLEERFGPVSKRLQEALGGDQDLCELYCQVLEHKWYLSERARRDVGFDAAVDDYLELSRRRAEQEKESHHQRGTD
jgi:Domain of unknown function (DUF4032)/Lipopolysaccharide kinase (Kdo/WaaP) family